MPATLIEVRRAYSEAEEVAIMTAVQTALVDAFKIPAGDNNVRLVVHAPHRFSHPPELTEPDRRTLITIDCFPGRSLDAKRALYAGIVTRLAPLGIPTDHVMIALHEVAPDNWGIRGGQAASDVELGFDVNV